MRRDRRTHSSQPTSRPGSLLSGSCPQEAMRRRARHGLRKIPPPCGATAPGRTPIFYSERAEVAWPTRKCRLHSWPRPRRRRFRCFASGQEWARRARKVDSGKAEWIPLRRAVTDCVLTPRFPVDEGYRVKADGSTRRKARLFRVTIARGLARGGEVRCIDDFSASDINAASAVAERIRRARAVQGARDGGMNRALRQDGFPGHARGACQAGAPAGQCATK